MSLGLLRTLVLACSQYNISFPLSISLELKFRVWVRGLVRGCGCSPRALNTQLGLLPDPWSGQLSPSKAPLTALKQVRQVVLKLAQAATGIPVIVVCCDFLSSLLLTAPPPPSLTHQHTSASWPPQLPTMTGNGAALTVKSLQCCCCTQPSQDDLHHCSASISNPIYAPHAYRQLAIISPPVGRVPSSLVDPCNLESSIQ